MTTGAAAADAFARVIERFQNAPSYSFDNGGRGYADSLASGANGSKTEGRSSSTDCTSSRFVHRKAVVGHS